MIKMFIKRKISSAVTVLAHARVRMRACVLFGGVGGVGKVVMCEH